VNKRERVLVRKLADTAQKLLNLHQTEEMKSLYVLAATHGVEYNGPTIDGQKAQSVIDKVRELVP